MNVSSICGRTEIGKSYVVEQSSAGEHECAGPGSGGGVDWDFGRTVDGGCELVGPDLSANLAAPVGNSMDIHIRQAQKQIVQVDRIQAYGARDITRGSTWRREWDEHAGCVRRPCGSMDVSEDGSAG